VGTTSAMAPIALQQDPRSNEPSTDATAEDYVSENTEQNSTSGCGMTLDSSEKMTAW